MKPSKRRNSSSGSKLKALNDENTINVICRFRPSKPGEVTKAFDVDTSSNTVTYGVDHYDKKLFSFDKIFDKDTTQKDIFVHVENVVDSVMAGFNGTIFAYGQTSAGKSWTMEGILDDPMNQGIIPRAVDKLFDLIEAAPVSVQFQVKIAYYEIYCEKVRDLLNPASDNLKLREIKNEGFIVQDLTELYCGDRSDVINTIQIGKTNRASAPTLMNAESSRSHSILSLTIKQVDEETGRIRNGRLFLVDLAGSEKVSKTGASGMRLEEAKNINSSLTTLGMVINALCDHASHVPYRDSKLTRLLMDSLGGNSRTTMIICCSLDQIHSPETLSTLRFGERAKRIENHATVNEELSPAELQELLNQAKKEIQQLKKTLQSQALLGEESELIENRRNASLNAPITFICNHCGSVNQPSTDNLLSSTDEYSGGTPTSTHHSGPLSRSCPPTPPLSVYRTSLNLSEMNDIIPTDRSGMSDDFNMSSISYSADMNSTLRHTSAQDALTQDHFSSKLSAVNMTPVPPYGIHTSESMESAVSNAVPLDSNNKSVQMLQSRVMDLENEIETERIKSQDMKDLCLNLTQETEALKESVAELQAKILQMKMAEQNTKHASPRDLPSADTLLQLFSPVPQSIGPSALSLSREVSMQLDVLDGGNMTSMKSAQIPVRSSSVISNDNALRTSQSDTHIISTSVKKDSEHVHEPNKLELLSTVSVSDGIPLSPLTSPVPSTSTRIMYPSQPPPPPAGEIMSTKSQRRHSISAESVRSYESYADSVGFIDDVLINPLPPSSTTLDHYTHDPTHLQQYQHQHPHPHPHPPQSLIIPQPSHDFDNHNSANSATEYDDPSSSSNNDLLGTARSEADELRMMLGKELEMIENNYQFTHKKSFRRRRSKTSSMLNKNAISSNSNSSSNNLKQSSIPEHTPLYHNEREYVDNTNIEKYTIDMKNTSTKPIEHVESQESAESAETEEYDEYEEVEEDGNIIAYAEKNAQLRDEYEVYIQRLMSKLLEEQQHRCMIEEQLEDSEKQLRRIYHKQEISELEENKKKQKNASRRKSMSYSSIWSMFGLGHKDAAHGNQHSSTSGGGGGGGIHSGRISSHRDSSSRIKDTSGGGGGTGVGGIGDTGSSYDTEDMNDKSQRRNSLRNSLASVTSKPDLSTSVLNLTLSLDFAQQKIDQLTTDLTTCKEAHSIVLETKETVMRSLVKQNTILVKEQEELMNKNDELQIKVEQLTQLLRTVSAPLRTHNTAGSTTTNPSGAFTVIKGGGRGSNVSISKHLQPQSSETTTLTTKKIEF